MYNKWEKYEYQNMSFAFGYNERAGKGEGIIVFIDNGVMLYSLLVDVGTYGGTVEYLETANIIQKYENVNEDYLVYFTDEVLYCPALGLKVTCQDEENEFDEIFVTCRNVEKEVLLSLNKENMGKGPKMYYMTDAENAQDVVNNFVNRNIDKEGYMGIEGIIEKEIAGYNYLGRGYWVEGMTRWPWGVWELEEYIEENYLFYSNDLLWSISVSYDKGDSYDNYLKIIESYK